MNVEEYDLYAKGFRDGLRKAIELIKEAPTLQMEGLEVEGFLTKLKKKVVE